MKHESLEETWKTESMLVCHDKEALRPIGMQYTITNPETLEITGHKKVEHPEHGTIWFENTKVVAKKGTFAHTMACSSCHDGKGGLCLNIEVCDELRGSITPELLRQIVDERLQSLVRCGGEPQAV